jgi:hypothetical protein
MKRQLRQFFAPNPTKLERRPAPGKPTPSHNQNVTQKGATNTSKQASRSFLKKRTKKLPLIAGIGPQAATTSSK